MSQETKAQGTEAPGGGVPPQLHTPPPPVQRVRLLGIPPVHLQATPGQVHNPAWSQPTGSGLESNSAKPPFCHLKSRHVSYHIESLNKLSPKGPLCARRCYRLQGVRGRGREPGSRGPHPQACSSQPGLPRSRGRRGTLGHLQGFPNRAFITLLLIPES